MGNFTVDWGFSWSVVLTGLVVVFVVLILLVFLCFLMGKIFTAIGNKPKKENEASTPASVPSAPAKPQGGAAVIEMHSEADEVIAVITAAITAMMTEDGVKKPFAIKSIKRTKDARSAWNAAGIQDNTRPF